ncbi:MAG: HEAT repeat domain-containing protein [Planctomycetes bacterium]|nr:HEAT repeat domain-containing protein [Planctomycetota bacterium]
MLKSLLAAAVIAALTLGGMALLKNRAPSLPDYSEAGRRLHDPSASVRKAAVSEVFGKADLAATRTLLSIARDEDPGVRGTLDNALLQTRDKTSLDWLATDGLTFPERWTRYYAVRILSRQLRNEALPKLLPLLAQNYWQVQIAILDAVAESGELAGATEALGAAAAPGQKWEVRERAIRLLGEANTAQAAGALLEKALPPVGQPPDAEAERAVENALATMKDAEALKFVAQGLGSTDAGRKLLAVKVLGLALHTESVAKFKEFAADTAAPTPLRVAALRAAVQAGAEDGVTFAFKVLDGNEPSLRLEAAYALTEASLSPEAKASVKSRAERESDWRVKEALGIATGDK